MFLQLLLSDNMSVQRPTRKDNTNNAGQDKDKTDKADKDEGKPNKEDEDEDKKIWLDKTTQR